MRTAVALLLVTASLSVGCVSERIVSTEPMIGSLRDGSGPAPAVTPATPSPAQPSLVGGDAQQTRTSPPP